MRNTNLDLTVFLCIVAIVTVLVPKCHSDEIIPESMIHELYDRRSEIQSWAITCPSTWGEFAGQYSHVDGTCWQGDSACFAGLSCLAAVLAQDEETAFERCGDIAAAQESTGRWCRGPTWVDKDYPDGDFSRDQTRGVFAYFLANGYLRKNESLLHDHALAMTAAQKWLDWIDVNGERICLEDKGSCELTVATHNMFYNVYKNLGILATYGRGDPLIEKFYKSRWYYRWGFNEEVKLTWTETALRGKFYPLHLKAASLLLYRVMNLDPITFQVKSRRQARMWGKAARRIWSYDKTNPLYRLLYEGVTRDLVRQVLDKYTSATKPPALNGIHDFAWQRHTSERAWERSDGHDQIFLINLIIARLLGRLPW